MKEPKIRAGNLFNDECCRIILEVAERAAKDYLYYIKQSEEENDHNWDLWTAEQFIFNEEYLIDWGDEVWTPRELLQRAGIEIEWLRRVIKEKLKKES